ncbi:hypothetical protein VNO78_33229 [Psophocarpus tetragonolobus]|uniref:Uncharacterized protein n=1 Tax=Psophocarpus tetragonolobus TaxID=3891 RepID=A0AAN9NWM6_PSOTE
MDIRTTSNPVGDLGFGAAFRPLQRLFAALSRTAQIPSDLGFGAGRCSAHSSGTPPRLEPRPDPVGGCIFGASKAARSSGSSPRCLEPPRSRSGSRLGRPARGGSWVFGTSSCGQYGHKDVHYGIGGSEESMLVDRKVDGGNVEAMHGHARRIWGVCGHINRLQWHCENKFVAEADCTVTAELNRVSVREKMELIRQYQKLSDKFTYGDPRNANNSMISNGKLRVRLVEGCSSFILQGTSVLKNCNGSLKSNFSAPMDVLRCESTSREEGHVKPGDHNSSFVGIHLTNIC